MPFQSPRGFSDAFRGFQQGSHFPDMGGFGRDPRAEQFFQHSSPSQQQQQQPSNRYHHHHHPQHHSARPASPASVNEQRQGTPVGGGGGRAEAIPIRVIHEKTGSSDAAHSPRTKHPHSSRNTTDLPARGSPTPESPRLERAHSEPPKNFQQRIFQTRQPPNYTSIPEQHEQQPQQQQQPHHHHHHGHVPQQQHSGLEVPAHNLSTSASAPSVPSSSPASQQQAPPQPPPRRSSPNKVRVDGGGVQHHPQQYYQQEPQRAPDSPGLRKQSAPPGVRHIPIFVEGREGPVGNRNAARRGQEYQREEVPDGGEFRSGKPSDFYPTGVKRVPRADAAREQQNVPARQRPDLPGVSQSQGAAETKRNPDAEPTSPLSPPPGPIPMGCSPSHLNVSEAVKDPQEKGGEGGGKKEPTSPMPAPPGPIPMPCSPDLLNQNEAENSRSGSESPAVAKEPSPQVQQVPVKTEPEAKPEQKPQQAERKLSQEEVAVTKMQKVKDEVAQLMERISNFKGDKKDKEYLYLDEMLTRHLLSLDGVDTCGKDDIRQMRKESIKTINRCLSMLDAQARGGAKEDENKSDAPDNNAVLEKLAEMSSKDP